MFFFKTKYHIVLILFLSIFSTNNSFCSNSIDQSKLELPEKTSVIEQKKTKNLLENSWVKLSKLYLPSISTLNVKNNTATLIDTTIKESDEKEKNKNSNNQAVLPKEKNLYLLQNLIAQNSENNIKSVFEYLAFDKDYSQNLHKQDDALVDDTTYIDLLTFCGKKESLQTNFAAITDNTYTVSGKAAHLDILYNPLMDIEKLEKRQQIIKMLVENDELYKLLCQKFEQVKINEKKFFLILNKLSQNLIETITDYFYFNNMFTDIPVFSFVNMITFSILSNATQLPGIKRLNNSICSFFNKRPTFLEIKQCYDKVTSMFMPLLLFGTGSYFAYLGYKNWPNIESYNNVGIIAGLITGPLIGYAQAKGIISLIKTEVMIHELMVSASKFVHSIHEIQDIVKQHPELSQLNTKYISENLNDDLQKLLEIFKSNNFDKKSTWTTPKGKAFTALKLLLTIKDEIYPPYIEIGKIDAHLSIATLFKKNLNNKNAKYYWAKYIKQNTPYLIVEDGWNVFLDTEKVVLNSIELGKTSNYTNMLITGPNAGGKSTILKTTAFAVLSAQTLTITAGKTTLTPFHKLFTMLNITDSMGKESLYQADKNRVKFVLKSLETLPKDKNAIVISDEMFNSTGAKYGSALYYATLKYITDNFSNTLFAAATHFDALTEISKDTNNKAANFRVEEAVKGNNGKYNWSYKIQPGINKQNIAIQLAQEDGFDKKFINAAKDFLAKIPANAA